MKTIFSLIIAILFATVANSHAQYTARYLPLIGGTLNGDLTVKGNLTSSTFFGNGSGLTGTNAQSMFSASAPVFQGSNITMPNQTLTGSTSVMTEGLSDTRYEMPGVTTLIQTSGSSHYENDGTTGNKYGIWKLGAITNGTSVALEFHPDFYYGRDTVVTMFGGNVAGTAHYNQWLNAQNGGGSAIVGSTMQIYTAPPWVGMSGSSAFADGDVLTNAAGTCTCICNATASSTVASARWVTGTSWFTTGDALKKNGVSTGYTYTGGAYTSGLTNNYVVYTGHPNGGSDGICIWVDSASSNYAITHATFKLER